MQSAAPHNSPVLLTRRSRRQSGRCTYIAKGAGMSRTSRTAARLRPLVTTSTSDAISPYPFIPTQIGPPQSSAQCLAPQCLAPHLPLRPPPCKPKSACTNKLLRAPRHRPPPLPPPPPTVPRALGRHPTPASRPPGSTEPRSLGPTLLAPAQGRCARSPLCKAAWLGRRRKAAPDNPQQHKGVYQWGSRGVLQR